MFTVKTKRSYRTAIMAVVILLLCILLFIVAWPEAPVEQQAEEPRNGTGTQETVPDSQQNPQTGQLDGPTNPAVSDSLEGETGNSEDFAEKENMNPEASSYYLVRRAGSQIVVYFCDSGGNLVQLETTEILYDMMGPEDQKLFDAGIRVDSQEQLSVLLQDFES